MPGFSKKDQARLALLVLGQRGKLEKMTALPPGDCNWLLVFSLRLATLLHRSRDDHELPDYRVKCVAQGFQLELPADWLGANPLAAAALTDEAAAWQRIGQGYRIRQRARLERVG